ncbi:hypothetical protein AB0E83_04610 [Streptomyces sp. NPDC035033]|uniref:hypothetical protein n=1 Tax=Streptomyces sp. NPDC035033 TaxID=3155368 RepID=UPI0033DC5897
MTGLRRIGGAVTALLAAVTLGTALVLLAGFTYRLATGDPTSALAAWAFGLLILAAILFAVFGGLLPDQPEPPAPDGPGREKPAGRDESPAAPADSWTDVLAFCLVLLGLVVGGPLGIAGYEALRPPTAAVAPQPPPPPTEPR